MKLNKYEILKKYNLIGRVSEGKKMKKLYTFTLLDIQLLNTALNDLKLLIGNKERLAIGEMKVEGIWSQIDYIKRLINQEEEES